MYAVIETGGKQYRVEVGTVLEIERLEVEAGDAITLDRVLLVADGDESAIGRPLVADATVSAEILRQDRGDKVINFKYRPKARRRVKKGHRQELTVLRISDITFNGRSAAEASRESEAAAKTERERLEEAAARQAAEDAALAAKLAARQAAKAAPSEGTVEEAPPRRGRRSRKTEPSPETAAPADDTTEPSPETAAPAEAEAASEAPPAESPAPETEEAAPDAESPAPEAEEAAPEAEEAAPDAEAPAPKPRRTTKKDG
jgi:large subunit ribosomal protein L21